MKKLFAMTLALMVAAAFAAPNKVKSKLGDVELTKEKGGGSVVCTAGFNDELTIVKDGDTDVLVKGSCGQGWVPKSKVEYVAALAGDKSMKLDGVDVVGWLDNPSAVFTKSAPRPPSFSRSPLSPCGRRAAPRPTTSTPSTRNTTPC